jgi:spore coat polysaccharide biosynthesis predicted glycosyltransferase SpsG
MGPGRVVFRCDGDERIGAGHVARCLPLAKALAALGWQASFAGAYSGLAGWLLERSGLPHAPAGAARPCGLPAGEIALAVIDSYALEPSAICELAQTVPVLTLAEANRCPQRGILLDYHLDVRPARAPDLLAGPAFAPLDPAFAAGGRAGAEVGALLVTLGGARSNETLLERVAAAAAAVFPRAEILATAPWSAAAAASPPQRGGPPPAPARPPRRERPPPPARTAHERQSETNAAPDARVRRLAEPSSLLDVVSRIDLAIAAAGLTSYELACAGVPQLAIAVAGNQRRVIDGLRRHGLALCLDLTRGDSLAGLPGELRRLRDRHLRSRLSRRGMHTFDGRGAERAAAALTALCG